MAAAGTTPSVGAPRADAALMAELLISAVREAQGIPGVLVRDINLDPDAVLTRLQALRDEGVDLRIAYLNADAAPAATLAGITDDVFSTDVEDAELWRNEVGLEALVVVITETDAAKLTSLEEFRLIGPAHLRRLLVERAVAHLDEVNDVLPRWWGIIGKDEQISFFDLVDYFLALEPLSDEDAKRESALQINRLGLLPDPAFSTTRARSNCALVSTRTARSRSVSRTSAKRIGRRSTRPSPRRPIPIGARPSKVTCGNCRSTGAERNSA